MDTYVGMDLGGTKLLIGELDKEGNILNYKKYDSGHFDQQRAVDIIKQSFDDYQQTVGFNGHQPAGLGIGLVGRVDTKEGIWLQIDPKRTQSIELAKVLTEYTGIPSAVSNDVKAATSAEQKFGYGRQSDNFIYINVGTGIAAGFVVNGKQIRGSHYNAGEVGHTQTGVGLGLTCGCGRKDCVELIASGLGIERSARLLQDKYETKLQIPSSPEERIYVGDVFTLSREGDPLCSCLVENASAALANLIMNLVRVTDPDTVVLGGGVVADGYMLSKIKEKINPTTVRFVTNGIVITELKPEFIGLLGAGAVAMDTN